MIVADTHVLLWWASRSPGKLPRAATKAFAKEMEAGEILVSSISTWEIAMLVARGRLALSLPLDQWLATLRQVAAVRFVPVDNDIALESVNLPGDFHRDPADRIIVASARILGAPIVTADDRIRHYRHVETIW